MEYSTHWATMVKCSLCGEIPERNVKGGSTCTICKTSGVFAQSKINTDFLNKIRTKPGIGRPYRYNTNSLFNKDYNYSRTHNEVTLPPPQITIEGIFQLPSDEIRKLLSRKNDQLDSTDIMESSDEHLENLQSNICTIQSSNISSQSKIPIKCPHNPCNKMVAVSSFVTHFKHEHADIPKYNIERGKELCIPCDISLIEHSTSYCIGMITVYEINKIDVKKSKSSQSVIKTCSKFCQQIPICSFWLMSTGSVEKQPFYSYALYWLFTTSEESYQSTIELSSKHDSITLSTYCGVNNSNKNENFDDIAENLNCLLISKASLGAVLKEGPEINLRITVH
ncbi:hypothetical protein NQ314_019321 [Rhamnusium bicolor]|uniref:DUF4729 domain-containing protein n=1 Tax=Rhamnusium bicolor TaxID=1586634 RepID=A0AAV8WNV4_9CUCU|nr:hypothetical protein NQ314_019321 [Rhamnusium bicolor]